MELGLTPIQLKRENRKFVTFSSELDGRLVRVSRDGLASSYGRFAVNHIKAGRVRNAASHARVAAHHAFARLGRMGVQAAPGHNGPGSCQCHYL